MLFRYVERVAVMVHTADTPDLDSWRAYCELIPRVRSEVKGVLVFTLGGAPNSKQREQMRLALGGLPSPPVAILTTMSPIVRNIITSLNWFFGQSLVAFAADDVDGALRHLGLARGAATSQRLLQTMGALAAELAVPLPWQARPIAAPR